MRSASIIFAAAACTAAVFAAACGSSGGTKTATPPGRTPGTSVSAAASPSPAPSATATAPAAAATPTAQAAPPTQAPAPTQPPAPRATNTSAPPPPPPPSGVTLPISAQGVAFSTRSLSAPAGSAITIAFNNMDSVSHNIQFLRPDGSSIGATEVAMGPVQQTLSLGALAPGTYSYKCDVHPQQMNGTLTVS